VMAMTEHVDGRVWYASAAHLEESWSPVEVARGYFYGPGDLRVDPDGAVHMAWHNHDLQSPDHLVIRPGQAPVRLTIDTPGLHDGWDNSLAIGPEGDLHQASVFPIAFGAMDSLQYGRFNGTEWAFQDSIPGSGPFMYGLNTSLAVDRQGIVHIVYCQATDWATPGDLKYVVGGPNEWQVSAIVTNGIRGRFPSIALDHWDRPHVAWLDLDDQNPNHGFVRYAVLNTGEWGVETVDELDQVDLGFLGARKSVSLALDRSSRPHLAYSDRRRMAYAVKPFDAWMITNVVEHSEPTYNGLVVLRLNTEDDPAIVFWEPAQDSDGRVRLAAPRDPNVLLLGPVLDPLSGALTLRWTSGLSGMGYVVEAREQFGEGMWNAVSGPELLTDPTWTDPLAGTLSRRFYRVQGVPLPNP